MEGKGLLPVEAYPAKKQLPLFQTLKIDFKRYALFPMATAAALCLLAPLLMGTAQLNRISAAIPLELVISLVGVVLLTPVFLPEQQTKNNRFPTAQSYGRAKLYLIRIIYSVAAVVLLIGLFAGYMKTQGSDVTLVLTLGTVADAVFLGSLGMLTSSLTGDTAVGYIPPVLYYALNIAVGPKLGGFYLFTMTVGNYQAKIWFFAAGLLIITVSLILQKLRK